MGVAVVVRGQNWGSLLLHPLPLDALIVLAQKFNVVQGGREALPRRSHS